MSAGSFARQAGKLDKDTSSPVNIYPGVYVGIVKDNADVGQRSGRLKVHIPEFLGEEENPNSWIIVNYASPFYGVSPHESPKGDGESQLPPVTTYGFWAIPPDVGVRVLCTFIKGEPTLGYWFAVIPGLSHGMVPAAGAPDGKTPVMDVNPYDPKNNKDADISKLQRQPFEALTKQFTTQGIAEDPIRGPITSSSFRESPSRVFGISSQSTPEAPGHSFVMDDGGEDGTNKLIRIRTSSGNQITMNDDTGMIYLINAGGTGWVEISPSGQIDVYGEKGINMATPGDINFHADNDINLHANNCIKIVAANGAKLQGSAELQLHGAKTMIEGVDSLHVHSCKEMMFTSYGDIHMKAFNYFCLKGKCFYWNSCTAKESEQVPPEQPQDVSGYQTTVARAPSKEPYKEHDSGQGAGGGGAGGAGGGGEAGAEGSGTNAGDMVSGTASESPVNLSNPITVSNSAAPNNSIQLTGGTLADAGGLSSLSSVSGINAPFRTNTGGINTPLNSTSSMGMSFTGTIPSQTTPTAARVGLDPGRSSTFSQASSSATSLQNAQRTTPSNTTLTSTYTPGTTYGGNSGIPETTGPGSLTLTQTTTTQAGPMGNPVTTTRTETISQENAVQGQDTFSSGNPADMAAQGRSSPAQDASSALDQLGGMAPSSDLPAAPGGGGTGCFATGDNCERPADETGSGAGGGQGAGDQGAASPGSGTGYDEAGLSKQEIEDYIREDAKAKGLDPEYAVAVARREGLSSYQSNVIKNGIREPSYSVYQLYYGGGLGNQFTKETGIDLRTNRSAAAIKQSISWTHDYVAKRGINNQYNTWRGQWYGARKI